MLKKTVVASFHHGNGVPVKSIRLSPLQETVASLDFSKAVGEWAKKGTRPSPQDVKKGLSRNAKAPKGGAGDGTRTRHVQLGKLAFYH